MKWREKYVVKPLLNDVKRRFCYFHDNNKLNMQL